MMTYEWQIVEWGDKPHLGENERNMFSIVNAECSDQKQFE